MKFLVFALFVTLLNAGLFDDVMNSLGGSTVDNAIDTVKKGITDATGQGSDSGTKKGTPFWETWANGATSSAQDSLKGLFDNMKGFTDSMKDNGITSGITSGITDQIKGVIPTNGFDPKGWLEQFGNIAPNLGDSAAVDKAKSGFTDAIDQIKTATGATQGDIDLTGHVSTLMGKLADLAKNPFNQLSDLKNPFTDGLNGFVTEVKNTFGQSGADLGVGSFAGELAEKTNGFFDKMLKNSNSLPGTSMIPDFEDFRKQAEKGIQDAMDQIKGMGNMTNNANILNNLKDFVEGKSRNLETLSILDGLSGLWGKSQSSISDMVDQIAIQSLMPDWAGSSQLTDAMNIFKNNFKDILNMTNEYRSIDDLEWIRQNATSIFNSWKEKLPVGDLVDQQKLDDALKQIQSMIDGKIDLVELRDKVVDVVRIDRWVDADIMGAIDKIVNGTVSTANTENLKDKLNDAFKWVSKGVEAAKSFNDIKDAQTIFNHVNKVIESAKTALQAKGDSADINILGDFQQKVNDLFNTVNDKIGCSVYDSNNEANPTMCSSDTHVETCTRQGNVVTDFLLNKAGVGGNSMKYKCGCCFDPSKAMGEAAKKIECFEFFENNSTGSGSCTGGTKQCQNWPGLGELCWCCGVDEAIKKWNLPTEWKIPELPGLDLKGLRDVGCKQYQVDAADVKSGSSGLCPATSQEQCLDTSSLKNFGFNDQYCLCCDNLPNGESIAQALPQFKLPTGDLLSTLVNKIPIFDLTQCKHYQSTAERNSARCNPTTHEEMCLWAGKMPFADLGVTNLCTCCPNEAKGKLPELELMGCRGYTSSVNPSTTCDAGKEKCIAYPGSTGGFFCTCCDGEINFQLPTWDSATKMIPNVTSLGCEQHDEFKNKEASTSCSHTPLCADLSTIGIQAKHCVCCDGATEIIGTKNWIDTATDIFNKVNNTVKADGTDCNDVAFFDDKNSFAKAINKKQGREASTGMDTCQNSIDVKYNSGAGCESDERLSAMCCQSCKQLGQALETDPTSAENKPGSGKNKHSSAKNFSILLIALTFLAW